MKPSRFRLAAAGIAVTLTLSASALAQEKPELPTPPDDMPDAFQQLLPRGQIASVDAPEFISAAEAELGDDAWVLGVVIDGQARAYSLNLLNRHEIVNDRVGETAFAAVW